jgi:hypothetical protein
MTDFYILKLINITLKQVNFSLSKYFKRYPLNSFERSDFTTHLLSLSLIILVGLILGLMRRCLSWSRMNSVINLCFSTVLLLSLTFTNLDIMNKLLLLLWLNLTDIRGHGVEVLEFNREYSLTLSPNLLI